MPPKQRKPGQFGGDDGRANRRAFRADGGKVESPKDRRPSCGLFVLILLLCMFVSSSITIVGIAHIL